MKRLVILFVALSFLAPFAILADPPATKPHACRCGPSCACVNCGCDREPDGVIEANSPLANGVQVAMLQQDRPVEDRRPFAPQQSEALIEKKQVEGLLTWIGEFVTGAVTFFAFWTWIKTSLWMVPLAIFAGPVVAALIIRSGMRPQS